MARYGDCRFIDYFLSENRYWCHKKKGYFDPESSICDKFKAPIKAFEEYRAKQKRLKIRKLRRREEYPSLDNCDRIINKGNKYSLYILQRFDDHDCRGRLLL